MNVDEMSELFDTLISVHSINYGNGITDPLEFNEYEKSQFLTKAQMQLIIAYYNGRNNSGLQFEVTEEDRRCLDSLVNTKEIQDQLNPREEYHIYRHSLVPLTNNSYFYKLPNDLLFITYESCTFTGSNNKCINGKTVAITPVTQDEFHRIQKNPFKSSNDNRVLRLDCGNNIVELISTHNISKYTIRYIRKPKPIILVNLQDEGLTIDSQDQVTPCELNEQVHNTIVELAVQMALQSKSINTNNK